MNAACSVERLFSVINIIKYVNMHVIIKLYGLYLQKEKKSDVIQKPKVFCLLSQPGLLLAALLSFSQWKAAIRCTDCSKLQITPTQSNFITVGCTEYYSLTLCCTVC